MGFIDYQGTKENRYTDVLEFAKAQQEEEARRLEDEKVGKWVTESIGDARYVGMTITDVMKYIIVLYRKLVEQRDALLSKQAKEQFVDVEILWKDFSIATITNQLKYFGLPEDKRNIYYQTFLEKVFKVAGATSAEKHYGSLRNNASYQRYFSDCFDMVQEKQFWKWMGYIGENDNRLLVEFVNTYEQLSILLGYYLFQGIRPGSLEWMRRLDIECQVLKKLKVDYGRGCFKEPNYNKLQNPLYERVNATKGQSKIGEESRETIGALEQETNIEELHRPGRPQLDKNRFGELLEKKQLLSYVEACRLLRKCELPEEMDNLYKELIIRMPILQQSLDKFEEVYQPDMYQFYEYYIPEALQLTATYIEYLDVGIGERILQETENEVLDAAKKLLIAVNDTIDEIYKFASMEIKAKAKALESIMSQDGYVDPNLKIN